MNKRIAMTAVFWVLALSAPLWAGLVTRPTKTCGTTTYTGEVANGCTTIKSSEVDADLNAIITEGVNNIETANVNASGLGTAAYANLSVSAAKLAVGASINTSASATVDVISASVTSAEQTLVTLPSITTRGGTVVIGGMFGGYTEISSISSPSSSAATYKLKRGGSTILTWTSNVASIAGGAEDVTVRTPLGGVFVTDTPAAGSYVYSITITLASGTVSLTTDTTNPGKVFALELS